MGDQGEEDGSDTGSGAVRRAAGLARSAASSAAGLVAGRRFSRTPAGKARAAAERGATTFHIRLDLDDISHRAGQADTTPRIDDAIGSIEAEGWRLDDLEYVTETDEWEERGDDEQHRHSTIQRTFAVMLFRRSDDPSQPAGAGDR